MRVELDEDSTRRSEKLAGDLGMSVNGFINWLVMSTREVNIVEASTVKLDPQPPAENVRPKLYRYRKSWISSI